MIIIIYINFYTVFLKYFSSAFLIFLITVNKLVISSYHTAMCVSLQTSQLAGYLGRWV